MRLLIALMFATLSAVEPGTFSGVMLEIHTDPIRVRQNAVTVELRPDGTGTWARTIELDGRQTVKLFDIRWRLVGRSLEVSSIDGRDVALFVVGDDGRLYYGDGENFFALWRGQP